MTKKDLAQMNRAYFENLDHESLVNVADKLRDFGVELIERLEQNSGNSSRPPSSDSPYNKDSSKSSDNNAEEDVFTTDKPSESSRSDKSKRSPGKQPGAPGFWRKETPVPEDTVPHYPEQCAACGRKIFVTEGIRPYMGHHVFEIEKTPSGIRVFCTLHHYYAAICECGHENNSRPGEGNISGVEGRKKDLKLTEYVMAGPKLAAFIAALSVRFRMSRVRIREFLAYWLNTELSVGTIDRCIREAGVSCFPVVEELIGKMQDEGLMHLDETPWYEKGALKWLWVAISELTAVYMIGTRKKEELSKLITNAFVGWLISDGYGAYRDREKRQRCLAHLIRKAVALTGAVDEKARKMGEWFLRELRGLIKTMSGGGEDEKRKCSHILARLGKVCNLGSEADHPKLRALANEILNDWDAVVAFVKNPGLPATNNEAERALRHAVISRRISYGTRTPEGSKAYAALLSVIETCLLRNQDPWTYIAQTISLGRKGMAHIPIPQ